MIPGLDEPPAAARAPDLAPLVIRLADAMGKQADAIREMQQTIAAQADQIVSLSKS